MSKISEARKFELNQDNLGMESRLARLFWEKSTPKGPDSAKFLERFFLHLFVLMAQPCKHSTYRVTHHLDLKVFVDFKTKVAC